MVNYWRQRPPAAAECRALLGALDLSGEQKQAYMGAVEAEGNTPQQGSTCRGLESDSG